MIQNWDRLVLKGLRSSDNDDRGNIIAIDKDSLFLITGRHVINAKVIRIRVQRKRSSPECSFLRCVEA